MDLAIPVAIKRRSVLNPGASVRSRAPRKSGFQVLLGDKEKVVAFITKSTELNKNLMTRMSPSAQWKQHAAIDHWCNLVNVLVPGLDKERYWDTDIIKTHGMHMVLYLVCIPIHTYIYISS